MLLEVARQHLVDREHRVDAEAAVAADEQHGGRLRRIGLAAGVIDARQIVELAVELGERAARRAR